MKRSVSLTERDAVDVLRHGGCLHSSIVQGWGIIPGSTRDRGGLVTDEVAKRIIARPDVKPGKDSLFPGHDQTWRMLDSGGGL